MLEKKDLRKLLPAALLACAVLVGPLLPGCSGCRGSKAPVAFAPADALGVVVVPRLSEAMSQAKAFFDRFKDNPLVAKAVQQGKAEVVREIGFDPEKPETLKKIGIDPGRGLVAHIAADGKSVGIAVGVSDKAALDKYIAKQAAKVNTELKDVEVDGVKVKELRLKGGTHRLGAFAVVKKTLIICPEAADNKHAAYVAKLTKLKSDISDNKQFVKLSKQVGKHQLLIYVDGEAAAKASKASAKRRLEGASEFMKKYVKEQQETEQAMLAFFRGAAVGFYSSSKGAGMRGYMAVPDEKAKKLAEVFKGKGDPPEFGRFIGPDALSVSRASINVKAVMDKVIENLSPRRKRRLYRQLERLEKQSKIDVRKVLEELPSGRYAAAVYPPNLDPQLNLGSLMSRPEQALGMISTVLFIQVTDTDRAAELLAKLERMMVMGRMDVRIQTGKDELKRYFLEVKGKKVVGWTVKDGLLVVATGDRLDKTLTLMEKGGDNVLDQIESSRAKGLFKSDDGNVGYFNLSKMADMVRGMNLPAEVKLMMSSFLSLFNKLADLTGSLEVKDAGVLVEISLRLADQ